MVESQKYTVPFQSSRCLAVYSKLRPKITVVPMASLTGEVAAAVLAGAAVAAADPVAAVAVGPPRPAARTSPGR